MLHDNLSTTPTKRIPSLYKLNFLADWLTGRIDRLSGVIISTGGGTPEIETHMNALALELNHVTELVEQQGGGHERD